MELYEYKSYLQYTRSQIKGYRKKKDKVWARRKNIKFICKTFPELQIGICHGVRTGKEVSWFRKILKSKEIIGTEIGASIKGLVVKWDFNKPRMGWVGKFDFVYTNSFDHAFDPVKTLQTWKGQLRSGGLMIIETSTKHETKSKLDPFGITGEELEQIMRKEFRQVESYDLPLMRKHCDYHKIYVGRK